MTSNNNNNIFRGTILTFLFKIVSFLCTQATLRVLDPTTLGKAHIQLELLLTTILFVSREGFRLALTRNIDANDKNDASWINVAWLTIPLTTLISGTALIWHMVVTRNNHNDWDYFVAGVLYCIASWIEGCAEPAVLYFLRQLNVPKRTAAESVASVTKTLTIVLGLQYKIAGENYQVTVFGLAQLVYGMTYALFLYQQAYRKLPLPNFQQQPSLFDWNSCRMTAIFTFQGFFKHLLTEADKIVLTAVSDNYNQGVYAMGSSYGGMAARLLLQPLEENARLLWSRLATRPSSSDNDSKSQLKQSYTALVKMVLYLGLLFGCVAVNYTNLLLSLLAGRTWGSNPEAAAVLSAFCVYTAFLALNGMTEAFVYAAIQREQELTRLSMAHTATGIVFALCAPSLVTLHGTVGLVAANCVAMSIRSIYSIHFAAAYFEERTSLIRFVAQELLPHPMVLLSFGASFLATRWSLGQLVSQGLHQVFDIRNKEWLYLTGQHLAVGISSATGVATIALYKERRFLRSLRSMVRPKQD